MNYVRIMNENECPIEGFTKLGVSTARGNSEKIGQFGSGTKMGALCLLRFGIVPIIYSGKTKIEFSTEKSEVGGQEYDKVLIAIDNKKPQETSLTLQYGELDWQSPDMGIREFVSNAIDQGKYKIDLTDKPRAKIGFTSIFIPCVHNAVQEYVNQLHENFLHFNVVVQNVENTILAKMSKNSRPRAYRKGVFVREFFNKESLFDYNFGENLKIDDCRNSDDWQCKVEAGKMLAYANEGQLQRVFKAIIDKEDVAELYFSHYDIRRKTLDGTIRENWQTAWKNLYHHSVIATDTIGMELLELVQKKGYRVFVICKSEWYGILKEYGIPTYADVDVAIGKNDSICNEDVDTKTESIFDAIWKKMELFDLTYGKEKPALKTFKQFLNGGCKLKGYYEKNCVFINDEYTSDFSVYLEELTHHITGSTDNSRDFQDFAFRMAAIFMRNC